MAGSGILWLKVSPALLHTYETNALGTLHIRNKKIAVPEIIYCINWEMSEYTSFLRINEIIFSCITTFSENCFTSVLLGVDQHLSPVNRYSSPGPLDYILPFLCILWFCLRNNIFDVTPEVFYWIRVWRLYWPLYNVTLVGLEPRFCCLLVCFLEHPFPGHFLFSIKQHDLFKYPDVFKLIHVHWYVINRSRTRVWETSPCHDTCTTMLHCLHSALTVTLIQYLWIIWQTVCGP